MSLLTIRKINPSIGKIDRILRNNPGTRKRTAEMLNGKLEARLLERGDLPMGRMQKIVGFFPMKVVRRMEDLIPTVERTDFGKTVDKVTLADMLRLVVPKGLDVLEKEMKDLEKGKKRKK